MFVLNGSFVFGTPTVVAFTAVTSVVRVPGTDGGAAPGTRTSWLWPVIGPIVGGHAGGPGARLER